MFKRRCYLPFPNLQTQPLFQVIKPATPPQFINCKKSIYGLGIVSTWWFIYFPDILFLGHAINQAELIGFRWVKIENLTRFITHNPIAREREREGREGGGSFSIDTMKIFGLMDRGKGWGRIRYSNDFPKLQGVTKKIRWKEWKIVTHSLILIKMICHFLWPNTVGVWVILNMTYIILDYYDSIIAYKLFHKVVKKACVDGASTFFVREG